MTNLQHEAMTKIKAANGWIQGPIGASAQTLDSLRYRGLIQIRAIPSEWGDKKLRIDSKGFEFLAE